MTDILASKLTKEARCLGFGVQDASFRVDSKNYYRTNKRLYIYRVYMLYKDI